MLQFPDHTREMRKGEEDAVDALLKAAFETDAEVALVKTLRKSGQIAGETVLPMGGRIVGYCALSKMVAPKGWLCLAPVAISPDVQGRNFGTRMLGMLTEWAKRSNQTVVVLGAPDFYERAGFSLKRAKNLTSPYPISHTMIAGPGENAPNHTLKYPRAFANLD